MNQSEMTATASFIKGIVTAIYLPFDKLKREEQIFLVNMQLIF